jgi:hypothetical protein
MDSVIPAGVSTTLCLYTALHLNSHDARSLSAECESSIAGKCALVTGIMYSLTHSISPRRVVGKLFGRVRKIAKSDY